FGRMLGSGINSRNNGCYPPNPDSEINSKLPQKFTGKERDSETRLDYFGARYYSAAQGRFISADAPFADQHSEDPQSWNLYSYVRNKPLTTYDPDGRQGIDNEALQEALKIPSDYVHGVVKGQINSIMGIDGGTPSLVGAILLVAGVQYQKAKNASERLGMEHSDVAVGV